MAGSSNIQAARDYAAIERDLRAAGDREARMGAVVDLLWDRLAQSGISWVGFYTGEPGSDSMILGPRRDKPACSPIGVHGACGRSWISKASLVVTDVAHLGAGYIACDPRDRAEVVVPVFDPDGACWGVLDVDSFDAGAFSEADAQGLWRVLKVAGLTHGGAPRVEVV